MARISTYPLDNDITVDDIVLGTDSDESNGTFNTKNFAVGTLSEFIINSIDNTNYVRNTTDTFTSTPKVLQMVTLTAAQYASITPDSSTIYIIL